MPSYAPVSEDYSIGRPLTGDILLSNLVLTGWGAVSAGVPALVTWTDRGRVWAKLSGTTLTLYRSAGMTEATDRLCAGTVSGGLVTLSELNSSGITGSARVTATQDSTCSVILSYAHEKDIEARYVGLANELDSNSKWLGRDMRFEALLKESKRELDAKLRDDYAPMLPLRNDSTPDLTVLSDARQDNLVRAHVWLATALLYGYRGAMDATFVEAERYRRKLAREELQSRKLGMDYDADSKVDVKAASVQRLVLG